MLSLPAAKPHSPHKRSLGIILREETARLMLSLPVCKSRSPPERPLGLIFLGEDHTETRLMPSLGAQQMVSGFRFPDLPTLLKIVLSIDVAFQIYANLSLFKHEQKHCLNKGKHCLNKMNIDRYVGGSQN